MNKRAGQIVYIILNTGSYESNTNINNTNGCIDEQRTK